MKLKYNNVYVGAEDKRIRGKIHGIKKMYRMKNGFIFEFDTARRACESAQVFLESGYETVRVI